MMSSKLKEAKIISKHFVETTQGSSSVGNVRPPAMTSSSPYSAARLLVLNLHAQRTIQVAGIQSLPHFEQLLPKYAGSNLELRGIQYEK